MENISLKIYRGMDVVTGAQAAITNRLFLNEGSLRDDLFRVRDSLRVPSFNFGAHQIVVACESDTMKPIGVMFVRRETRKKHFVAFFVKKSYRRKRIASRMFQVVERHIQTLTFRTGPDGSKEFFHHIGTTFEKPLDSMTHH